ncbi:TATA box-binding protein-associated factor RNA polymerase I subunit B [Cheilinus undulatus]|uniref:TATA box-binding protein-associated factor RNA polymerase I subunit B n=1 Tax=Cheilinus undulatus TaxID=241271 RepID=UPI001BD58770|nr:TATA box-binding protein-associated factor RNA polymerase I subunit B [Cheilinus undulatus]
MDDEHTAEFTEPCAQCSAVNWGISDEGRFYCKSCHNVIERTREVVDPTLTPGSSRISTIGRGSRTKRGERGRLWMICEGFQFILMKQADALLRLGVPAEFKDGLLCELWRLYLQKTEQAYTHTPVRSAQFQMRRPGSDSESATESVMVSASETDGETTLPSTAGSNAESCSEWTMASGSVDAASYRRGPGLMSMRKTLALIHIALTWSCEPLTLSDLLRLVNEGHIPYVNAHEVLPEEMKVEGKDAMFFRVVKIPSYQKLHKEAQALILFLKLPAFPPVSRQNLLHPALLSLRYLTDANLPDELHPWLCRLMEHGRLADEKLHTFHPVSRRVLPKYDLQAAALVIITMKLFFGLDDHAEWDLSNDVGDKDKSGNVFSMRRWFRLLQPALIRARETRDQNIARKQWKSKRPFYCDKSIKYIVLKKKRVADQYQICFEKLSSRSVVAEPAVGPSSFTFCWGDEDGADGPSMHHMKLGGAVTLKDGVPTFSNQSYWHPALRPCNWKCLSHYSDVEPTLPRMFVWVLQLFSFMMDVKPELLYEEVLSVERRVLTTKMPWTKMKLKPENQSRRKRKRNTEKPKTTSRIRTRARARAEEETETRARNEVESSDQEQEIR